MSPEQLETDADAKEEEDRERPEFVLFGVPERTKCPSCAKNAYLTFYLIGILVGIALANTVLRGNA